MTYREDNHIMMSHQHPIAPKAPLFPRRRESIFGLQKTKRYHASGQKKRLFFKKTAFHLEFCTGRSYIVFMNIGRPLEFNPDQALEAAMQLFWRQGYESSSMQQLLTTMGLSKSSFYQHFKSKHQLFQSSVKHYENTLIKELTAKLDAADNGLTFITELFDDVKHECAHTETRMGCMLMNTVSEFAQDDPVIAQLVNHSLERFYQVFLTAVKDGQQAGLINPKQDAATLARYLISSMSGLKNMVKSGADAQTIKQINSVVLANLH